MTTGPTSGEQGNTYFMDAESSTEMARLMHQDRIFTRNMGGVFPEKPDLSDVHDILDIGCGPGGWVIDVAQAYPKIRVVGCDISKTMIEYARAQAWSQGLDNARFELADALKGLAFEDASFDIINARLITGFMPRTFWPKLIEDCKRVLRPGGLLRLTECEAGFNNSLACAKMTTMFTQALYKAGMSFSPDGSAIGITPMLARFLRNAGFQDIDRQAHVIDYSSGNEAHESTYQDLMVSSRLMQPFLIKKGTTTQTEIDEVYRQALIEMMQDDFCAVWYYLTVWGRKP